MQTVNITYVVSGHKNVLPANAHSALEFCQELISIHGEHLKHISVYLGDERLWTYQKKGPHR